MILTPGVSTNDRLSKYLKLKFIACKDKDKNKYKITKEKLAGYDPGSYDQLKSFKKNIQTTTLFNSQSTSTSNNRYI